MSWAFYLTVSSVLFAVIAGALVTRHLLMRHLEKIQRKAEIEKDARSTAEANSGL